MIPFLDNWSVRSADDLLADLKACRSLRHLADDERADVVERAFANRTGKSFCWVSDAVGIALSVHGYSCDTCGAVTMLPRDLSAERLRVAADRVLSNLDGFVKLLLCKDCARRLANFASRTFNREVRTVYTPDLEKMMVAFIASEIVRIYNKQRADAYRLGHVPRAI